VRVALLVPQHILGAAAAGFTPDDEPPALTLSVRHRWFPRFPLRKLSDYDELVIKFMNRILRLTYRNVKQTRMLYFSFFCHPNQMQRLQRWRSLKSSVYLTISSIFSNESVFAHYRIFNVCLRNLGVEENRSLCHSNRKTKFISD
jgi:hypothetical protein